MAAANGGDAKIRFTLQSIELFMTPEQKTAAAKLAKELAAKLKTTNGPSNPTLQFSR